VTVVSGITSAQAMAARLNLSLTHRDHAQSLTLTTGHSRKGDLPETIDWAHAASPHVTTVFYMGARMAGIIRERLFAGGINPATPVVAIASISRPEEQVWSGPVSDLEAGIASLPTGAPILIGLGHVFGEAGVQALRKAA
jgi:uroporphyrin-III C-methyltransferase/precorrin-2 dehydrogenase/sirohydrochlorin ferrochelatase